MSDSSLHRMGRSGVADLFVARPILAMVLNLLVLIAGLAALTSIDVREMPDVEQPVLSIRTGYEGAVPATVDRDVTQVLEDALSDLDGVSYMESQASTGSSRITVDLSDGIDVDIADSEARENVSATLRQLPDDIDDSEVTKSDTNSDAIIRLAILGDATLDELTALAEGAIYDRLSLIDGSAQTLALRVGNSDITIETIEQIPVDATTRVSDIAFVQLTAEDSDVSSRVNGVAAIGLDITRQSVGNTLSISKGVRAAVGELQKDLSDGVELLITTDDGVSIENLISEVIKSILLATCIVIAVIFAFLRSFRATLIPAVTMPVALIGTLAAIWLTGFSVNTISLVALVLATGLVVDDTETDVNLVPGGPPINDPSDLESLFLRLPDGEYVPLSVVATLETIVSASQIERQGGSLAVSVQANLGSGVDIGTARAQLESLASEMLPAGMVITYTDEAATLADGQAGFYLVFGMALLVVFLILSAQFESFVRVIVILLTVPFGLAAALMAILLTGGSLNYYSQIGLVMLIVVMAKNGILIVEFANQLREAGQDIDSAIRDAPRLRIRPVMMTMVSTVCGGLPLIFSPVAGAEARIAVGWVIVGELGFATTFTLFLTPVFYRWIAVWGNEPGMAAKSLKKERQVPASVS